MQQPTGAGEAQYIRGYFARDARTYDRREWFRRRQRQHMVVASGAAPGIEVLDVCTGTGELALALAAAGAGVVGVDLSPEMLALARRKPGANSVQFLEQDATRLPFADGAFAVSTLAMGLHCMPASARMGVLREMARVTRDRVVLLEPNTPSSPVGRAFMSLAGRAMSSPRYWPEFVCTDLTSTLSAAGLAVAQSRPLTLGFHRLVVCRPVPLVVE